jgi:hypothetical protein
MQTVYLKTDPFEMDSKPLLRSALILVDLAYRDCEAVFAEWKATTLTSTESRRKRLARLFWKA